MTYSLENGILQVSTENKNILLQWCLYKRHVIRKWSETWLGLSVEPILIKLCSHILNVHNNRLHSDSSLAPKPQHCI